MTRYLFTSQVVLNTDGSIGAGLEGQAFSSNVSGPEYTSDLLAADGVSPATFVTDSTGVPPWVFGPDGVTTMWLSFAGGPRFDVHGTDVTESLLQAFVENGEVLGGVDSGGSTLPVSKLTDTSGAPLVQDVSNLLIAKTQQAMRASMGAGTGNGNSNLAIGPLAGDAASATHTHKAIAIGFTPTAANPATDVQTAIANLGTGGTGGGGGSGTAHFDGITYHVRYNSGWPTIPTTPPVGCEFRRFYGPSLYLGASWAGVLDLDLITAS